MPDAETFVGESIEVALAEFFSDPDGDALAYAAGSSDEGVATVGVRGATLRGGGRRPGRRDSDRDRHRSRRGSRPSRSLR